MKKQRQIKGGKKMQEAIADEEALYQAIAAIKSPKEAVKFFQDLCTPAEIQAMADRWKVVGLLKRGEAYRKIYEDTGVSVTTVGRVARCLLLGEGGYNLIFKRLYSSPF